jgi:thioredoxin reductase (NADPH)
MFDPDIKIDKRKIKAIEGVDNIERLIFEDGSSIPLDGLFVAEGSASALDLAYKMGIENNGKTITVDKKQSTNLPGLFAAGDCTGGILQVSVAVGEGATAGMAAIEFLNKK